MGDRGNIIVKDADSKVYLYTHWSGSDLPHVLKRALDRRQRWDDGPYLTRIIFCEMIKGNEQDETGFGISSVHGDGNKNLTVDVEAQTVTADDGKPVAFTEFVGLS